MSSREELLSHLGLPPGAPFSEIEHAYIVRSNSISERIVAGDENARAELAILKEAFGRLTERSERPEESPGIRNAAITLPAAGEKHLRDPAWWQCYLSLLFALASAAALSVLAASLPHIYRKGGFLIPLALIVSAVLLSIVATMLSEAELRRDRRMRMLREKGFEGRSRPVRVRFYVARTATLLSRTVRWLTVPALIATVFLNFASLSGHWSIRK